MKKITQRQSTMGVFLILLTSVIFTLTLVSLQFYIGQTQNQVALANSIAGNWYVDTNSTCTSCDGKSWTTAWKTLEEVTWGESGIKTGDTLYISTGSYSGTLTIPVATIGTNSPITITKAIDPGHNGEVIISGKSYGINVTTSQDVVISHLTFSDSNGIYVNSTDSSQQSISIDNCKFIDFKRAGVFIDKGNKVIIKNSYFNDANENLYTSQSDGIYAQLLNNLLVDHNTIILDNNYLQNGDLHSDNIQTYYVKNVTYSNNIIYQANSKTKGTQMLFTEEGGKSDTNTSSPNLGIHTLVNNVLIRNSPNAIDSAIRLKNGKGTYFKPRILNNTYYGIAGRILNVSTTLIDPVIMNNIFAYTNSGDVIPLSLNNTNIIGPINSLGVKFANRSFDINTMDYHQLPGSTGIDKGTSLVQYGISTDRDNRPRDNFWDIGAYEYGAIAANPTAVLIPTSVIFPTVTFTPTPHLIPTISNAGSIIQIYAAGTPANQIYPSMDLLINGNGVAHWTNITGDIQNRSFNVYSYTSKYKLSSPSIKIRFINGSSHQGDDNPNLYIDKIVVDGNTYETESSSVLSVGSGNSTNKCSSGYNKTEKLSCIGYFLFKL